MPVPQGVSIRLMTAADLPAGLRLCRAARWNQTPADWEFFLTVAPAGALVAEQEGVVIGTVATVPYGPFTWISMVLVDPSARGQGVGRLLLERGLALVANAATARLDATPAGEPLYRTLGFTAEHRLARWFIESRLGQKAADQKPSYTRLAAAGDWPQILQMDRHVFGASRALLLQRLADDAPDYAWVLENAGRLRAYMFGRKGHVRDQLGPLVADTIEAAHLLLQACLAAHPDVTFFIDAPERDDGWQDVLDRTGFTIERPFLRMHRGRLTAPGNPLAVFAVTGPEFG